jgi:hypothetical protein
MVFSKSVDKTLFLYTDASRADPTGSSAKKDGKLRSVRPLRDVRVPNVLNPDLEKTMGNQFIAVDTSLTHMYNIVRFYPSGWILG